MILDSKTPQDTLINSQMRKSEFSIFSVIGVRFNPKADIELISSERSANDPKRTFVSLRKVSSGRSYQRQPHSKQCQLVPSVLMADSLSSGSSGNRSAISQSRFNRTMYPLHSGHWPISLGTFLNIETTLLDMINLLNYGSQRR